MDCAAALPTLESPELTSQGNAGATGEDGATEDIPPPDDCPLDPPSKAAAAPPKQPSSIVQCQLPRHQ